MSDTRQSSATRWRNFARQPMLWVLVAFALTLGGVLGLARSAPAPEPAITPVPAVAATEAPAPVVQATPEPVATPSPAPDSATAVVAVQPTPTKAPTATTPASAPKATATQAAFVHPWPLPGKHAQLACTACHATSAKPSTTCSTCHQQPAALHAQAPHNLAACDTCHKATGVSWTVATQTCVTCHADRQQHFPGRECVTCHAFKPGAAAFQHTMWPLAGKHAATACAKCHTSAAKPDANCASCHQQSAGLHARPAHAAPACSSCHGTAVTGWKPVSQQTCTSSCHANKTGHYPTQACATCHSFTGQAPGYAHAWPLSGKHASAACSSCHTGGGKPDPNCASCHKTTGGALHTKPAHAGASCQSCHGTGANGWGGVNQQTCLSCHGNKSSHYTGTSCVTCHAFTPRGTTFQHTMWPLAGKHQAAACNRCHTSSAKPSTACTACHKAPTVELHRKEDHTRASCQTCHGTTYTTWVVQRQPCLTCHGNDSDYKEKKVHSTTTDLCQSCHRFK